MPLGIVGIAIIPIRDSDLSRFFPDGKFPGNLQLFIPGKSFPIPGKYREINYTLGDSDSWTLGRFWCKMAFFQRAWRRVNVLSRPGSRLIPIKLD